MSGNGISRKREDAKASVRVERKPQPSTKGSTLDAEARQLIAEQRLSLFRALCRREQVPQPETEYHFAKPERAWRFDLCWIPCKVALEVEGGAWTKGRHVRGAGFIEDMAKYNKATELGWRIYRVTPSQLDTLQTVAMIKRALSAAAPPEIP